MSRLGDGHCRKPGSFIGKALRHTAPTIANTAMAMGRISLVE